MDCRSKPERANMAVEGEVALVARETIVDDSHWKVKAEELMNHVGWGDDDSDDEYESIPALVEHDTPRAIVESDSEDEDVPPLIDR